MQDWRNVYENCDDPEGIERWKSRSWILKWGTTIDEVELEKRRELLCEKYDQIVGLTIHFGIEFKDVEDAVQEIFVVAYTHLHQLNDIENFDSWLYKIARRYTSRMHKSNRRRTTNELCYDDCAEKVETETAYIQPMKDLSENFSDDDICDMVASLEPPAPEIIRLRYVTGLTLKEIAKLMGLNYNTVKTLEFRARNKLRKMILERNEEL